MNYPQRKSPRLKNRDYSLPGSYFITFNTKFHRHCFGEIKDKKMNLSPAGRIARQIWQMIPEKFPHVKLDEFIVMPNHIHGIIEITRDVVNLFPANTMDRIDTTGGGITKKKNPMLTPASISYIIRWYKGRTSYEIHKMENNKLFQWHGRYHDRIIRNEEELSAIRKYIQKNPENWNKGDIHSGYAA